MNSVCPHELFSSAGLDIPTCVPWQNPISCSGSGVYVVSIKELSNVSFKDGFELERQRWQTDQEIIYISRGKRLSRRVEQFYGHIYGNHSPHRGGQAILLLNCEKMVSWAATEDYAKAEDDLLRTFKITVGRMPFGNRMRSAQMSKTLK